MIILILSNRLLALPKIQRPAIKTKVKYVLLQMMDPAIFKDMEIAHQLIMEKVVSIIMKDGISLLMEIQFLMRIIYLIIMDIIVFHMMDKIVLWIMVRIVIIKQDICVLQVIKLI